MNALKNWGIIQVDSRCVKEFEEKWNRLNDRQKEILCEFFRQMQENGFDYKVECWKNSEAMFVIVKGDEADAHYWNSILRKLDKERELWWVGIIWE